MKKLRHFRKLIAFLGFSPLLLQADITTFLIALNNNSKALQVRAS
ncbi:hypothetical protein [Helicobacter pylori]